MKQDNKTKKDDDVIGSRSETTTTSPPSTETAAAAVAAAAAGVLKDSSSDPIEDKQVKDEHERTDEQKAAAATPTVLHRATPICSISAISSSPGAFSVRPLGEVGEDLWGNTQQEQGEAEPRFLSSSPTDNTISATSSIHSSSGLVEAHPVLEIDPEDQSAVKVQNAVPVSVRLDGKISVSEVKAKRQQTRNHNQNKERQKVMAAFSLLFLFALVVGLVLGLVLGLPREGDKGNENTANPSTAFPFSTLTLAPTKADLLFNLPDYTLEALKDPSSPQSGAYQWILADTAVNQHDNGNGDDKVSYPPWKQQQRFALATFYYATHGYNWTHNQGWLDHFLDECQWEFRVGLGTFHILDENQQLTSLVRAVYQSFYLSNFKIRNYDSFIELPDAGDAWNNTCSDHGKFEHLWQYDNHLRGTLPPEIALLTDLNYLELFEKPISGMQGTLPSEIGLLTALKYMSIEGHGISGAVPTELLGLLTDLRFLDIEVPYLTGAGTIPTEVGLLSNAFYLSLAGTPYTTTLPTELGQLSQMQFLTLSAGPKMFGALPSELGLLSHLQVLQLQGKAQLHDEDENDDNHHHVPTEIGLLADLFALDLRFGDFALSPIPSEIGGLSGLEFLLLSNGNFSRRIPSDMGRLTALLDVDFSSNALTGSLPRELSNLGRLERLWLSGNPGISSTIPSEFVAMGNLTSLALDDTSIEGTIPSEATNGWKNLQSLSLTGSSISGTIPDQFCDASFRISVNCSDILCGCNCTCGR